MAKKITVNKIEFGPDKWAKVQEWLFSAECRSLTKMVQEDGQPVKKLLEKASEVTPAHLEKHMMDNIRVNTRRFFNQKNNQDFAKNFKDVV